jgi:two-component system chemotaxis response regulator CheY
MQTLSGKKILIVDSSELCRGMLTHALQERAAQVVSESASDAALLQIIQWHPDFIIAGIEIGRITGYDLCLVLKLMPDYAGIPIVLISSAEKDRIAHRAATVGADYYVHKDKELVAHIHQFVDQILIPAKTAAPESPHERCPLERVLIVDDSSTIRRIIGNILRTIGVATLLEAKHGRDGLKQLETEKVDLVLTDWNMPIMNGIEMVKEIRQQSQFANLPIIMITTEGGAKEVAEARAAGVNEHLSKPFSVQGIMDVLARLSLSPGKR